VAQVRVAVTADREDHQPVGAAQVRLFQGEAGEVGVREDDGLRNEEIPVSAVDLAGFERGFELESLDLLDAEQVGDAPLYAEEVAFLDEQLRRGQAALPVPLDADEAEADEV